MSIDLQKLEQKFNALLDDPKFVTDFEQWLESERASQNSSKSIISGCLPDLESVEFFDLMQEYRNAPIANQQMVIESFNSVKNWLTKNKR